MKSPKLTPSDVVMIVCAFSDCVGVVFCENPTHLRKDNGILYFTTDPADKPISDILAIGQRASSTSTKPL